MKLLTLILTVLGAVAAVVTFDVNAITQAIAAFGGGNIMGGLQDVCNAVGLTAGALHLHFKFNLFGLNVDTGN